jgi:hypothetical protein
VAVPNTPLAAKSSPARGASLSDLVTEIAQGVAKRERINLSSAIRTFVIAGREGHRTIRRTGIAYIRGSVAIWNPVPEPVTETTHCTVKAGVCDKYE